MSARPEKMFNIGLTIFDVPQSKLQGWLDEFASMENDSTVAITEVDNPFVEEVPKETSE